MIRRTINYQPNRRSSLIRVASIDATKPERALTRSQKAAVQKALNYIFQETQP